MKHIRSAFGVWRLAFGDREPVDMTLLRYSIARVAPSTIKFLGCICLTASLLVLSGCDRLPGKPKESDRWQPAEANKDFKSLFAMNCRACHGDEGVIGPSISVLDPFYATIVPGDVLKKVIAEGIPRTGMPGFARSSGGELTDEQVEILVNGIKARGNTQKEDNLPPYSAPLGNAGHGSEVFNQDCAGCHGQLGQGGKNGGSVVEPDYLRLVSDQYLRSVIVAGRPELGMPNSQKQPKGPPMSSEDISDVVAWLVSHRQPNEVAQATPSPIPNGTPQ
ncbi:MAG: c-type cytochrome [Verrucomicrobia bacterium]|nr:c-type cytochrome [Verrucomicrobiota bacterium]